MIALSPKAAVYCAVEAVDFRNGIDGLARLCEQTLSQDPFSGNVFLFRNRRRTAVKILVYDGQGFWMCLKRLSKGRFGWWGEGRGVNEKALKLLVAEVQVMLWNGNPDRGGVSGVWRAVA